MEFRASRKTGRTDSPCIDTTFPLRPTTTDGCVAEGVAKENSVSDLHGCKRHRVDRFAFEYLQQEIYMYISAIADSSSAVDVALHETARVLRACWWFRGDPRDAFEPVRFLSPMTVSLLLTYGRYKLTADQQYVALHGGAEQLPWVGHLLVVLERLMDECTTPSGRLPLESVRSHAPLPCDPGLTARNGPCSTSPSINEKDSAGGGGCYSCPSDERSISRVLLLNCHGFGWLDSIGNEDYERSCQWLHHAENALERVVYNPAYNSVGRPRSSHAMRSSADESCTVVLLGDAIVTDGGVPSLSLARTSTYFMTTQEYGRGLACLLPKMLPVVSTGSSECRPANDTHRSVERWNEAGKARLVDTGVASCFPPAGARDGTSLDGTSMFPRDTDVYELQAVNCGACVAPGVAAQAILLGPIGPLVLHVQFDDEGELARSLFAKTRRPFSQDFSFHPMPAKGSRCASWNQGAIVSCTSSTSLAPPFTNSRKMGCQSDVCRGTEFVEQSGACMQYRDLTSNSSTALTAEEVVVRPEVTDFCCWLIDLLSCPQPVLLVEWHRYPVSQPSPASPTFCDTKSESKVLPFVLHMLMVYVEATECRAVSQASAGHGSSTAPRDAFREQYGHLKDITNAIISGFNSHPATAHYDGKIQPIVLTRGLEVAAETECSVRDDFILTSLQYRRLHP